MNILLYPGSFKPPHKGHIKIIEKLYNKYDKIIIIISKNSRPLDNKLLNFKYQTKDNLIKICNKYFNYNNNITKKNLINMIEDGIKNNIIKVIDANTSYNIWNIYITSLCNKYKINKNKFKIIISKYNSPILDIYKYLKNNKISVIKSEKNINNKRFNNISSYVDIIISKTIKNINSTLFRNYLLNNKNINKFLPKYLNEKEKNSIYKLFY